jgi:hypothetical protein
MGERFLGKLACVTDPETKRKIIGNEFIRVFEEEKIKIKRIYRLSGNKEQFTLTLLKAELQQLGLFGTSIATCIMVMKKNKTDNKTMFIDASNECIKVTNNNKLTPGNIERIVDIFAKREEVKHLSYLANYKEIAENDFNLSVSTYVESEDTRENVDILKLNAEIEEIVMRENELREAIHNIIEEIEANK